LQQQAPGVNCGDACSKRRSSIALPDSFEEYSDEAIPREVPRPVAMKPDGQAVAGTGKRSRLGVEGLTAPAARTRKPDGGQADDL